MHPEKLIRRAFLRRLIATARGRAHVLSLMVAAEEADEAGVFDQLMQKADDPELRRRIERHRDDELRHAALFRACIERNGVAPGPVPDNLMLIRHIARVAGKKFATGMAARSAAGIASREDVMNTYALLLAIEERGVQQFPLIGSEFSLVGDRETADTFAKVTEDERRHTKYCRAIGRRYAPDEATWQRAIAEHRAIEKQAFAEVSRQGLAYAIEKGFVWQGVFGQLVARGMRAARPHESS
jgi:rubrerythrin